MGLDVHANIIAAVKTKDVSKDYIKETEVERYDEKTGEKYIKLEKKHVRLIGGKEYDIEGKWGKLEILKNSPLDHLEEYEQPNGYNFIGIELASSGSHRDSPDHPVIISDAQLRDGLKKVKEELDKLNIPSESARLYLLPYISF